MYGTGLLAVHCLPVKSLPCLPACSPVVTPSFFLAHWLAPAQLPARSPATHLSPPPSLTPSLRRLVKEHRSALENFIFDKGTEGLAAAMCVDQLELCDWHGVMDSGEL